MSEIGEIIRDARQKSTLTQDEYAAKYRLSAPALFRFEKRQGIPTIDRWIKMAGDDGVSERRAVLIWARALLPTEYQKYIEVQGVRGADAEVASAGKRGIVPDYAKLTSGEQIREVVRKDKSLPKALSALLADEEIWTLFKPTGYEINTLRDMFGPLGEGSETAFREALRLIREFTHSF